MDEKDSYDSINFKTATSRNRLPSASGVVLEE